MVDYHRHHSSARSKHEFVKNFQINSSKLGWIMNLFTKIRLNNLVTNVLSSNTQNTNDKKQNKLLIDNFNEPNCVLDEKEEWIKHYFQGLNMEIYSARFPKVFDGLTFSQVALICRQDLNILLIAVFFSPQTQRTSIKDKILNCDDLEEADTYDEKDFDKRYFNLSIAPTLDKDQQLINHKMSGIFVCESQESANKVTNYCPHCHTKHNIDKFKNKYCVCINSAISKTDQFKNLFNFKTNPKPCTNNLKTTTNSCDDDQKYLENNDSNRVDIRYKSDPIIDFESNFQSSLSNPQSHSQTSFYDNDQCDNTKTELSRINKTNQTCFQSNLDITGLF